MPATLYPIRFTALAVALALGGCAGVPNVLKLRPTSSMTSVPQIAPSASAAVKPGLSIDRWWTYFSDPNLDRLMDEALAHNEDLESAIARVREAQASLDIARAGQMPTLDLSVDTGKSQRSTVGATPLPPNVDRRSASNTLSLNAGYELDLWGRLASTTAAARHQLLSTEWARSVVEWSLTARVAEAYFEMAAVDRQIAISQAVRASRATTLKLRQREHAAGAGNEFDLRRAEAEVTATDSSIASLSKQRVSLERVLTALLGRTPTEIASATLTVRALDESRPLEAILPQGAMADLLVRRPDVKQAEEQLAAANANIEVARAATLPSVRLSGVIGSDAKSVGNLFSGPATIWSITASASQSIFDGGRLRARVREEHARGEQTLATYRRSVSGAVLDVREAYATLDVAHQAFEAERDRVASLARARELAKLGFDNGALPYLELLDAERTWYQAQLNQVTAYRDRLTAQVAAFKALGGGYIAPLAVSLDETRKTSPNPNH